MQEKAKTKGQLIREDSKMLRRTANSATVGPILSRDCNIGLEPASKKALRVATLLCGTITTLIGGLVLVGWVWGLSVLTSVLPDYIPTAPNTALLFIVLGTALFIGGAWPANRIIRSSVNGAGLLTLIVTAMSLIGSVLGLVLEIGHWLLPSTGTLRGAPIGLMSPITSFNFILSGAALLFMGRQARGPAGILGTLVMLIGWVNVTGYWYGAPLLYGGTVIPVALPTSLAFMLLGAGLVSAAGLQQWPLSILSGTSTRAILLRGLLPGILIIVLVQGWLNAMVLEKSDTSVVLESAAIAIVTALAIFLAVSKLSRAIGDRIDQAEQELLESEEKYRSLFEDSIDGIFITTTEGTLIDSNQSFLDLFGYTKEEMLGTSVIKLYLNPEDRNLVRHDLEENGSLKDYPLRFVKKDGTQIDCLLTAIVRKASDGTVHGYRGIIRDITERKIIEKKLEKSEQRYRALFESAGDSIYVIDLEGDTPGRIVSANGAAAEMHGYTVDELLNMTVFDLDSQDSAERGPERLAKLLKGETLKEEVTHMRKDGTIFPLEINARRLRLGDHTYCIAIDRDITDRKVAELALMSSEERMRILIEVSPIGIRVARKGLYIYANLAFARIFGYDKPDEIIGLPVVSLYVPEERELIRKLVKGKPIGSQVPSYYEVTGQTKDGKRLDITTWVTRIDYGGEPATLGFVVDVSSEKSLRTQLIQAQKMEAIGALAGGIVHDFNNLLQIVLGYSDLISLRKKEGDPDYNDLQKIIQAGNSGTDLVKRLMMFSRKAEIQLKPINLNDQVAQVSEMLAKTISQMVKIETALAPELGSINADPTQLDQVLINLGVNARDAMPDGGTLTIETANVILDEAYCKTHLGVKPGLYVLLSVADTGQGMDRETLEHVFEPFFTTKEKGKGTGLGLSTVYGIVKQHLGSIECESDLGQGTTFKIYFPATQSHQEASEAIIGEVVPQGGTETILLVDDEESVRDMIGSILVRAGYTVITACDGKEALDLYKDEAGSISLVLLDLIMPEMGGQKCLEELLNIEPGTKILIATGYDQYSDVTERAIASGAMGSIHKPYSLNSILATVREILDRD